MMLCAILHYLLILPKDEYDSLTLCCAVTIDRGLLPLIRPLRFQVKRLRHSKLWDSLFPILFFHSFN